MITSKDHKGDIIKQRALTHTPDGQIKSIKDNDKLIATYQYNHLRQRVSKTTYDDKGTVKDNVQYLWDKGLLSAEIKDDKVIRRYVYLDIMPVAVLDYGYDNKGKLNKTQVYSIHTDHLGTPKQITNQNQETVWNIEMDTFGQTKQIQSKDNFQFNLRFAGQYFDQETGYHYNYHRYYDPKIGRYLTSDPIGLAGGLNSYGYANGKPYQYIDPYGLYTAYWGGAGLNSQSPYMADQVKALQELGVVNVRYSIQGGSSTGSGFKDMGFDALAVKKYRRHFKGKDYVFDTNIKHKPNSCNIEQFNYIGYSYGSLLASHTAIYYANRGYIIDNLVLIGSPIGKYFLDELQNHKNIKNVIVVDLGKYGDPIYAGMSEFDLMSGMTLDKLAFQFAKGDYSGHFYYSGDNDEGRKRRRELAKYLWNKGLR